MDCATGELGFPHSLIQALLRRYSDKLTAITAVELVVGKKISKVSMIKNGPWNVPSTLTLAHRPETPTPRI
jgi:hypothetical protein